MVRRTATCSTTFRRASSAPLSTTWEETTTVTLTAKDATSGVRKFIVTSSDKTFTETVIENVHKNGDTYTATLTIPAQYNGTLSVKAVDWAAKESTVVDDNYLAIVDTIDPVGNFELNDEVQTAEDVKYFNGDIVMKAQINEAPVRHDTATRRPSHTREPTHGQHEGKEDTAIDSYGCRVGNKSHGGHYRRCDNESHDKELAGIRVVRKTTHDELAEGIGNRDTCHGEACSLLIEQTILNHAGSGKREVLANQIVGRITEECT